MVSWVKKTCFRMLLSNRIPSPLIDMSAKETCKSNKSAINPIKGGPNKNPKKEIVETKAKATLGEYNLDRPAIP